MSSDPLTKKVTLLEAALEKIASAVSRDHVPRGCILGLGSGSTVARFAKALGIRNAEESLGIKVVPSSLQSLILARENDLSLYGDSAHCPPEIEVAVDGADQVATATRATIKGGGGALLKEKIILSSAEHAFILGDEAKFVPDLKRSVPVEVAQFAIESAARLIRAELGAEPLLRKLDKGYPFYTESGNVILDCQFAKPIKDPLETERSIKMIPGVLEAGIFNCRIEKFYKAMNDGTFERF